MSSTYLIREIAATYRRHGWTLRRVLLSENAQQDAKQFLLEIDGGVILKTAEINALWFSRAAGTDRDAWELRLVQTAPFALFHTFAHDAPEAEREKSLVEMENRLKAKSRK